MKEGNLKTVKQFAQDNPAFPVGGVRWQIFNKHRNGLAESRAILRIGRKLLIDESRYLSWVYSMNQTVE